MSKTDAGNFFEDFHIGRVLTHATPLTLTTGDASLYRALYGTRVAVQSADSFAQTIGYRQAPLDDLLVFHAVFGKTVPDISLNAVANLGYAEGVFHAAVYPGDTVTSVSEVVGVKENSNGKTGTVYVRTTGTNQHGQDVLSYVRWVMVRKRDAASDAAATFVPELAQTVDVARLGAAVPALEVTKWDAALSGSPYYWEDYTPGERIDHVDGMTVEESDHMLATRLYQNTAKVHFNQHAEEQGRFGRRLIYGGHVISLARALAFNGCQNAFHLAAINGGRHVAPLFAGDTVFAWSEVLDRAEIPGRTDIGATRMRLVSTKDLPCASFPYKVDDGYEDGVILDFDAWFVLPRQT